MELALICPVQHIEMTSILAGRFCIAPIALQHEEYRNFFIAAQDVILDNGVFENHVIDYTHYAQLVDAIQPKVVIAPDIIGGDADENFRCSLRAAKQLKQDFPDIQVMFVPQCRRGDFLGFENALDTCADEVAFDYIGICRDAVYNAYGQFTNTKDQELNRFYFAAVTNSSGRITRLLEAGKKFHFLGIGDHIDLIQYYWFVESMDTASLFWQSYLGQELQNGLLPTCLKRPKDYFTRPYPTSENLNMLIEENCIKAQQYADMATALKGDITQGRL